jgi:cyanophycinase-like exopeptidase
MPKKKPTEEDASDQIAFATTRSHKAAEIAYDLAKNICQTCLFMNGGAATAIVAFLAKENVPHNLHSAITLSLGLYGGGTAAAALMMFFMMQTADNWNYAWYSIVYPDEIGKSDDFQTAANKWHLAYYVAFSGAIGFFLMASGVLGVAFVMFTSPVTAGPG